LHKPLFDANHGAAIDVQHLGNLPTGVTGFAPTLIAHQQHTRQEARVWLECCSYAPSSPETFAAQMSASPDSGSERFPWPSSFF
jgi:hypothetical protein